MESNAILPYLSSEKILSDLCHQLTKDIGMEEFVIEPFQPSNQTFEHLFNCIFPIIRRLETENRSKLNFILNRTDISESQLQKAIQKNKTIPFAGLVTELIIKRELQKVVIRNMHK